MTVSLSLRISSSFFAWQKIEDVNITRLREKSAWFMSHLFGLQEHFGLSDLPSIFLEAQALQQLLCEGPWICRRPCLAITSNKPIPVHCTINPPYRPRGNNTVFDLPPLELLEVTSVGITALSYLCRLQDSTVSQLFGHHGNHEFCRLLVRVWFDRPHESTSNLDQKPDVRSHSTKRTLVLWKRAQQSAAPTESVIPRVRSIICKVNHVGLFGFTLNWFPTVIALPPGVAADWSPANNSFRSTLELFFTISRTSDCTCVSLFFSKKPVTVYDI